MPSEKFKWWTQKEGFKVQHSNTKAHKDSQELACHNYEDYNVNILRYCKFWCIQTETPNQY